MFPGRASEDAVFSDREREDLLEVGMNWSTSRVTSYMSGTTYIAPTRAKDRLWLSFPWLIPRVWFGTVELADWLRSFPSLPEDYAAMDPSGNELKI